MFTLQLYPKYQTQAVCTVGMRNNRHDDFAAANIKTSYPLRQGEFFLFINLFPKVSPIGNSGRISRETISQLRLLHGIPHADWSRL
jgi:hypothetical protein